MREGRLARKTRLLENWLSKVEVLGLSSAESHNQRRWINLVIISEKLRAFLLIIEWVRAIIRMFTFFSDCRSLLMLIKSKPGWALKLIYLTFGNRVNKDWNIFYCIATYFILSWMRRIFQGLLPYFFYEGLFIKYVPSLILLPYLLNLRLSVTENFFFFRQSSDSEPPFRQIYFLFFFTFISKWLS